MGYAGATYLIQEFCNSLFDALFHILPLGSEMDKVDPTLARGQQTHSEWEDEANDLLNELISTEPVLVQISVAKRLRDRAERDARKAGEERVSAERVALAREAMRIGEPA
jgi:chlorophyllide a reductase subunit Z